MNKILFCMLSMALVFSDISLAAPQVQTKIIPAISSTNNSYNLLQLNGKRDIQLVGLFSHYLIEIPTPTDWKIDKISFKFVVMNSTTLIMPSNLIAKINGTRISSLPLTPIKEGESFWQFEIPGNLLNANENILAIEGFLQSSNDLCADIQNPGNWARITSASSIVYNYTKVAVDQDIHQFAFPFIQKQSLSQSTVTLLTPKTITVNNMRSDFMVAGLLGSLATWRGIDLTTVPLTPNFSINTLMRNNILSGTFGEINLLNLKSALPLPIDAAGNVLDKNNQAIPQDTGVIMLVALPGKTNNEALLVLTGSSPLAVQKATRALADPLLLKTALANTYTFIANIPSNSHKTINWNDLTIKDLGYGDKVLYAGQGNAASYILTLPTTETPKSARIRLKLNASPFLLKDKALSNPLFSLKINDKPANETEVNLNNLREWDIDVAPEALVPGENILTFSFDSKINNCQRNVMDNAWVTILDKSSIEVNFDDTMPPAPNFMQFADLLKDHGIIVLGNALPLETLLDTMNHVGLMLKHDALNVPFIKASDIAKSDLVDKNVLYISNLAEYADNIKPNTATAVQFDKSTMTLTSDTQKIQLSAIRPYGLMYIAQSPWDEGKKIIVVTGSNDKMIKLAIDLLNKKLNKTDLINNTIVVYENGTFSAFNINNHFKHGSSKGKGVWYYIKKIFNL